MTIHDEKPHHRRWRYYQTIQTQARTYYLSLIEKDTCASHGRYQKEKYEKRNLRFFGYADETYK